MGELKKRELIKSYIKEQDDEIYDLLVEEHLPLIHYFANRYNFSKTPYSRQDIIIELKVELYNAIYLYDIESKVDFHVFLYARFRHRLVRTLRYYSAQKRDCGTQYYFEADIVPGFTYGELLADEYDIEYEYEQQSVVDYNLNILKEELTSEEMELYYLYINGLNKAEIAKKLNIDETVVEKKLIKVRRKVRKLGKKRTTLLD